MKYDASQVKEMKFIDKTGDFTFKVTGVEEGISANKNTPFHKFNVESVDGEKSSVTIYLTEASLWNHKAFASALGFDVKGIIDTDQIKANAVGRKFIGTVETEVVPASSRRDLATGEYVEIPEKTYYKITKYKKAV
ncbi:MAG: hypothetical protein RBR02_06440 [Desulfuromonadaceae bacterium]|nr:hypothetical protein [Desulfuromonadaceae bacterium]